MTVKDILKLLSYGTEWRLIGARTGKIICTSRNKETTRERYIDLPVTDEPIKADFYVSKDVPFTEYIIPMVSIWVSGE